MTVTKTVRNKGRIFILQLAIEYSISLDKYISNSDISEAAISLDHYKLYLCNRKTHN